MTNISIIIPAKNEHESLAELLPKIATVLPEHSEIIVVDDGSSPPLTMPFAIPNLRIIRRAYNAGNGAAIKAGARAAKGKTLVFMDADGQHQAKEIPRLLQEYFTSELDMLVGAREPTDHASIARRWANRMYSGLASWVVGHQIQDLTSGYRIVNAEKFCEFLYLLPNGFSYPTTITMSFFRTGYLVGYSTIAVNQRKGRSHIRPLRDGLRFLIIIFKVAALYSPLKVYFPISAVSFLLGSGWYIGSIFTSGARFTNMATFCLLVSVLAFFFGLLSEQMTTLMFHRQPKD